MDKLHSKLGKRLSNRYLSSDAFTSSAGRGGERTVFRLGSILKKGYSKRYHGVGQGFGLFEFKNVVFRIFIVLALIGGLAYTVPFTRYATHRLLTKTFVAPETAIANVTDSLDTDEAYVAPQPLKTDAFVGRGASDLPVAVGTLAYDAVTDTLVGAVSSASGTSFELMLFSDSMYKGNFFAAGTAAASTEPDASGTSTVTATPTPPGVQPIAFEGVGYGQMLARIPPQAKMEPGTEILAGTPDGLRPIARVSNVEPDTGSSFTLVYAQLLVPPTHIYKIRLVPLPN